MRVKDVNFVKSSTQSSDCPKTEKSEFAFIGRSNVGKSSLINMMMQRKKLAKTSGTPGKTQLINHFLVNDQWYLVDLPGYGWAKTSKTNKKKWEEMIRDYLLNRQNLALVFVLIDIRLSPQTIDLEFITWMGEKQIPFILIFTKSDKISKHKINGSLSKYKHTLLKQWEEVPDRIVSSSIDGKGREEILDYIDKVLKGIPH